MLVLQNSASKKLEHATGIARSNLAVKKYFITLEAIGDKLDIDKLNNDVTSLNNLKAIVDDLDVDKLKTVPVDLKILSDSVDNYVAKNTKFNTLKTKVNN